MSLWESPQKWTNSHLKKTHYPPPLFYRFLDQYYFFLPVLLTEHPTFNRGSNPQYLLTILVGAFRTNGYPMQLSESTSFILDVCAENSERI